MIQYLIRLKLKYHFQYNKLITNLVLYDILYILHNFQLTHDLYILYLMFDLFSTYQLHYLAI